MGFIVNLVVKIRGILRIHILLYGLYNIVYATIHEIESNVLIFHACINFLLHNGVYVNSTILIAFTFLILHTSVSLGSEKFHHTIHCNASV